MIVLFSVSEVTEASFTAETYFGIIYTIAMNKNCYLQTVTVNKAGNPYVLDPDVSVSMT